jgi:hypothetical protein
MLGENSQETILESDDSIEEGEENMMEETVQHTQSRLKKQKQLLNHILVFNNPMGMLDLKSMGASDQLLKSLETPDELDQSEEPNQQDLEIKRRNTNDTIEDLDIDERPGNSSTVLLASSV